MTDDLVSKLDLLFDKLAKLGELVDNGFAQARQDNLGTNERITKQAQRFHEDLTRTNNRLDLVAAEVATVGDDLGDVKDVVTEQSEVLERIERRLNRDLDRLDDHGHRIEVIEAKTRQIPTATK